MTTATAPQTDVLRQVDLDLLMQTLNSQRARAFDVIRPARELSFTGSILELAGLDRVLTPEGFMEANGLYTPTHLAIEQLAKRLDIDLDYLRKCYSQKPELFAQNANEWLLEDKRNVMVRLLRSDDGLGTIRAFLSGRYQRWDNIDILMAALTGIQQAEIDGAVIDADLTETQMIVRVTVPSMAVYADKLMEGYRNPFDGSDISRGWTPDRLRRVAEREGQAIDGGGKVVFAGIVIKNSEVGKGRWTITPRIEFQACGNGLTFVADGLKKTHLGAEQEEGVLHWSDKTHRLNMELITSQAADVVGTFLQTDYVAEKVRELEEYAGIPVLQPTEVIAAVSKEMLYTKDQQALILQHFMKNPSRVDGVLHAVTSAAQVIRNGDTAQEMEEGAFRAMQVAHRVNQQLIAA
jgi:hypothetical protein